MTKLSRINNIIIDIKDVQYKIDEIERKLKNLREIL